jgi:hypothetical protein
MKCSKFLGHLETGGRMRRIAARFHAMRCPRCAAAREALAEAKRVLASAAPLSDHQRRLWIQAGCGAPTKQPLRRRRIAIAMAATVAVGVFIAVAVALWPKRQTPAASEIAQVRLQPPAVATTMHELDTAAAFTRLEGDVVQLQSELDRLGRDAALLDARQRVTKILTKYSDW